MWITAIDENGMGPVLGPLVVTAVSVRVEKYDRSRLRRLGRNAGIGDSKQVGGFGKMAWCESVALAAVEALSGEAATDADAFMRVVSMESEEAMRRRCPEGTEKQCWSEVPELPAWGGDIEHGRRLFRRLQRWGVQIEQARSKVLCVRYFNQQFSEHGSKTTVDLRQMEELLQSARQMAPVHETHRAICGMVGGIRSYPKYWGGDGRLDTIAEARKRCAYQLPGFEEVAFEVGADDRHMPVSLASMLGKYVRELWMLRQNRFYQNYDPELPEASGYHDPVTRRHIEQSKPLRRRLRLSEGCFLRVR